MDYRIKKGNEFLQFCFIYFSDFFSWPSNLCCRIGSLSYSDLQIACYFWCGDTWEEIVKDTGEEKGQGWRHLFISAVIPAFCCFIFWLCRLLFLLTSVCVTKKAIAPHSSTLAWKIPWTEEPGKLQSMGSLRVGHDWATSLSLFTFMYWRRK